MRYLTAGESHGPGLTAILEGMPAGVPVTAAAITRDLQRRMQGYGRGGRMRIERDTVEIQAGVRHGKTLGSPIALIIRNLDWENWRRTMAAESEGEAGPPERPPVTRPRPGHADLSGGLKFDQHDLRNVLERASARETAARVAVGAVCKCLLQEFAIEIVGHVVNMGGVAAETEGLNPVEIREQCEPSPVRCADPLAARAMMAKVDDAQAKGTSLGGVFEVRVLNLPVGLGTHVHWDRRLDGRLAQALMSIQSVKGVEIGPAFEAARRFGAEVQDEIFYDPARAERSGGFYRTSNFAGGLEGGITTGQPLVLRAAMKPISTQVKPLTSVDVLSKETRAAGVERTDVAAVPAGAVVGEAVVAFEIARALREKFGGDSLEEMRRNFNAYIEQIRRY
ncbi:MAG: chorismate synthase [candidate division NC10 bacterium]|nr:chorismate synthase [candidate division NC10 bacterium]